MSELEKWVTISTVLDAIAYALSLYHHDMITKEELMARVETALREVLPYRVTDEILRKLEEDADNDPGELLVEIKEILIRSLIGVAT